MNHAFLKPAQALLCFLLALCPLVFAETTSDTHDGLKQLLQRYPEADLDKDGRLSMDEARGFRMRMWREETEAGTPIERSAPDEENIIAVRTPEPTFSQVAYGELPGQYIDLWLPRNATPPCPAVFHLTLEPEKAQPPQLLLKDCLNVGIAVGVVHGRDGGSADTYFDDLSQAMRFLEERGHAHGIKADAVGFFSEGTAAEYVLYGASFTPADGTKCIAIKGAALLDPKPRIEIPETPDPNTLLEIAYPKAHTCMVPPHEIPPIVLLHTQTHEGDLLLQSLRLRGVDAVLNNAAANEGRPHLLRKAALFFTGKLRENQQQETPPEEATKENE